MTVLLEPLRRALRTTRGRVGAVVLVLIAAAALLAPPFLQDPLAQRDPINGTNLAPSAAHPLGTDQAEPRRAGPRRHRRTGLAQRWRCVAVGLSITLGALVGLVAGYWGGWLDTVLMRTVDGALAVPRLFIILLVLAMTERVPVWSLVLLIGATGWFGTSRIVRAEVLRLREESYIRAAEALGASRRRVIFQHLLPNTLGPLLVAATLGVGDVILLEAGLSFLGLGIQPPAPSWGGMILDAREALVTAPWAGLFPGIAIVLTVLSANLLGDAVRDAVDPRGA